MWWLIRAHLRGRAHVDQFALSAVGRAVGIELPRHRGENRELEYRVVGYSILTLGWDSSLVAKSLDQSAELDKAKYRR